MRYLIYIGLIFAIACSRSDQDQEVVKYAVNEKVDAHPGMKGVMLGSSIEDSRSRLKTVNPISGLKLDKTTRLSEEHAVSFSLADSLQKVGDYELGRITGHAYQDTIYTLKTRIRGELNVKGIKKVLQEIYGPPYEIYDGGTIFTLRWYGSDVYIYYDSYQVSKDLFAVLKLEDVSMADKLFEEPDPYDHDAAGDF